MWANVIFTLLRDSAGRPRFIIAIHEDITERKRAVERLQAKQELLDLAQKSARAMAFDWYIQQDVNVWSPEQEALYGLPPGSFDGTYRAGKSCLRARLAVLVKAIKHAHETGEVAVEFRVNGPTAASIGSRRTARCFSTSRATIPHGRLHLRCHAPKLAEEDLRRSGAFLAEAQRLSSTGSFSWRVATDEIPGRTGLSHLRV